MLFCVGVLILSAFVAFVLSIVLLEPKYNKSSSATTICASKSCIKAGKLKLL
jgi:hypothetical protein